MLDGRSLLLLEYAVLFFVLPVTYRLEWVPLPLFAMLWLGALFCLLLLLSDPGFERRRLWHRGELLRRVLAAAVPFVGAAPFLLLLLLAVDPDRLFGFVRQRPLVWALVMVLYPLLSVYPQGIVYRVFIFHRYRPLFGSGWPMILASGVAFAFVHVVFRNWIAPVLSLGGGVLFAWTYDRTESSVVAAIQHALFGCFLFTVGLGWYFYAGAIGT